MDVIQALRSDVPDRLLFLVPPVMQTMKAGHIIAIYIACFLLLSIVLAGLFSNGTRAHSSGSKAHKTSVRVFLQGI